MMINRREVVNWQLKHRLGMKRQIVIPLKPFISCFISLCSVFVKMCVALCLLHCCGCRNLMICRGFSGPLEKDKSFKSKAAMFKSKHSYDLQAIVCSLLQSNRRVLYLIITLPPFNFQRWLYFPFLLSIQIFMVSLCFFPFQPPVGEDLLFLFASSLLFCFYFVVGCAFAPLQFVLCCIFRSNFPSQPCLFPFLQILAWQNTVVWMCSGITSIYLLFMFGPTI